MKKTESGIAHLALIIVVVVVAVVGFAGWRVLQESKKSEQPAASTTSAGTDTTTETQEESREVPEGYVEYRNSKHNYSFLYPAKIQNGYGGCMKEPDSYRPPAKSTFTPSTVLEDENEDDVYVAVAYYYELTGEKDNDGYSTFSGCERKESTISVINDDEKGYFIENVPVTVKKAKSDADITKAVQNSYDERMIISKKTKSESGDWYNVQLKCVADDCAGGGKTIIRYYPTQKKVLIIQLGQYRHWPDNIDNPKTFYDDDFVDSFIFK